MRKRNGNTSSPEVRERAVRLVLEHRGGYASEWEATNSIASKIGCAGETLRGWLRRAERDSGSDARASCGMSGDLPKREL